MIINELIYQFKSCCIATNHGEAKSCGTQSIKDVNYKMKDNVLIQLSKEFAVDIIKTCEEIKQTKKVSILTNQLLRCGTSIGANIHEGNYAASRADFINKFQIALKECYETEYWLDILKDSKIIDNDIYTQLFKSCSKLRKILTASITTAKSNDLPSA